MVLHIIAGMIIIYSGCFLHIQDMIYPVQNFDDDHKTYRKVLYYTMAVMSFIHTLTVLRMSPYVMGEKRITFPMYIGAGLINLHNGILLLINPGLPNAYLLWGSVNIFLYHRLSLMILMFANIDFELAYTFSIIAGGASGYTMSFQSQYIWSLLLLVVLYAPFHEKVAGYFGLPLEDTLGNNKPSEKNITKEQKQLRGAVVEMFSRKNKEEDKLEDEESVARTNDMMSEHSTNNYQPDYAPHAAKNGEKEEGMEVNDEEIWTDISMHYEDDKEAQYTEEVNHSK